MDMAIAVGNSHINSVDQKKLRIESPGRHVEKGTQPSRLSSFIPEMGFKENSLEFAAIIRFLETITLSASIKTQEAVKLVDFVSPTDSPIKEAIKRNEKKVAVAKESSIPAITKQANTTEENEKQGD